MARTGRFALSIPRGKRCSTELVGDHQNVAVLRTTRREGSFTSGLFIDGDTACRVVRRAGLGIEAQKADVMAHVERDGCELIAEYTEHETGKKHSLDNRPELKKAIAQAKRARAILVVAKLDRLLRSTVVRTMLKTSGVRFIACDNPHANELTIDILAAVSA